MLLKKELRNNLKSFIIWNSIVVGFILIMIAIYPSFTKDMSAMNDMLKVIPENMLKAFNMDIIDFSSILGWYATEGYMFATILGGCFSAILAASIISKEESDKTAEFLLTKPISRKKIVSIKMLTVLIYILAFNFTISLVTLIGFTSVETLNFTRWALISIGPTLLCLTFASISFFISCFVIKARKVMTTSIGLVLGTYLLNMLSSFSKEIKFLKYITPYEYVNTKYMILYNKIPIGYLGLMFLIIIVSVLLTYRIYDKKDIEI